MHLCRTVLAGLQTVLQQRLEGIALLRARQARRACTLGRARHQALGLAAAAVQVCALAAVCLSILPAALLITCLQSLGSRLYHLMRASSAVTSAEICGTIERWYVPISLLALAVSA